MWYRLAAKTLQFLCQLCGQAFLLRALYQRHIGSRACQERQQINRTRAAIEGEGWKLIGADPLLPEILRQAGMSIREGPIDYDGRPVYGSYGPSWAVEAASALLLADSEAEEITRLLSLGNGNPELENALALAALKRDKLDPSSPST